MFSNYLRTVQCIVLALSVSSKTILNQVNSNPITIYENRSPGGIYSEDSWTINDEKEDKQKKSGVRREEPTNSCNKGLGACNHGNTVTVIGMPVKKELTSRGWSAGGMPFNILYMKSAKSQRPHFLPKPQFGIIAESQQLLEPMPQAQQQSPNPTYKELSSVIKMGEITPQKVPNGLASNRNYRTKGTTLLLPPRRHYSIIPQLFVSYGWGPIGK